MMEEKKKRPSVRTVKFASFQGSFIPKHGINRAGATTFMYRFPRGLGVTQSESTGDTSLPPRTFATPLQPSAAPRRDAFEGRAPGRAVHWALWK